MGRSLTLCCFFNCHVFFTTTTSVHLAQIKKPHFFTIRLIFTTIHGSHYTFWYYSWVLLYYFSYLLVLSTVLSAKNFQFKLNKLFSNKHLMLLSYSLLPLFILSTWINSLVLTMHYLLNYLKKPSLIFSAIRATFNFKWIFSFESYISLYLHLSIVIFSFQLHSFLWTCNFLTLYYRA